MSAAVDSDLVTAKELCHRWKRHDGRPMALRTVRRHISQFKLEPAEISGRVFLFRRSDVEAMEERRKKHQLAAAGILPKERIISTREAIKRARRGGKARR